jgi:adenine deaminase
VTVDQLEQRLARGMAVMVREGSSERNLVELIRGVVDRGIDTRHLMFCTDDKHPSDIRKEGHINFNVREAIRLGVPPLAAIQMATLNPAEHFRLDHSIGVLAPGRWADLTLCESLEDLRPDLVAVGGQVVAEGGRLVAEVPPSRFPDWLKQTVRPRKGLRPEDFELRANGSFARVKAIEVVPDQIYNFLREVEVPVRDGRARPDLENDVLLLAVVERHGKNGNLALGWTRGFGLKRGAMASSVAHDHHNLLVVGTNEADMLGCVRALEQSQGGFVAVEQGEVVALLPLPLAGLMSERPSLEVEAELARVDAAAASMGCRLKAPFMTLSFISLPSIPEAGFSDKGLIEVASQRLIPVFLEGR